MTPEEREAQQLARWLEKNPGTEPPADISSEVLESVYALRPELAPAARVTVGEILERVNDGPLARATPAPTPRAERREVLHDDDSAVDVVITFRPTNTVEPEEQDSESDIVVPFVDSLTDEIELEPLTGANTAPTLWKRARPWLFGGGAVTVLAAALLLFVVAPRLMETGGPLAEPAPSSSDLAAAPPPPPAMVADAETLEARELDAPARAAGRERSVEIPLPAKPKRDLAKQVPTEQAIADGSTAGGAATSDKDLRLDAPADDFADAVADLGAELDEEEAIEDVMAEPLSESKEAEDVGGLLGRTEGMADDELSGDMPSGGESVNRQAPRPGTAATSAPSVADNDALESVSRSSSSTGSRRAEKKAEAAGADSGPSLEQQARPAGTPSAPAAALKAQLDQGDTKGARDAARAAIKAGGLSNAANADVHWVLGLSLERLGNNSGATAAYNEAIRLRRL